MPKFTLVITAADGHQHVTATEFPDDASHFLQGSRSRLARSGGKVVSGGPMPTNNALQLTAEIVASFVERNSVPTNDLPDLIASVHRAIATVGDDAAPADDQRKTTPAQIRKSITPEALISFEDGKPYRLLKRHLATQGLTPEQYRAKWGLPADYPMTAPAYTAKRSALAKASGLGQKTRGSTGGGRKGAR